jgi:hypothetical protein
MGQTLVVAIASVGVMLVTIRFIDVCFDVVSGLEMSTTSLSTKIKKRPLG